MSQNNSTDHDLIYAVTRRLPKNARWSATQRQQWLDAMRTAVDLAIEVKETVPEAPNPIS